MSADVKAGVIYVVSKDAILGERLVTEKLTNIIQIPSIDYMPQYNCDVLATIFDRMGAKEVNLSHIRRIFPHTFIAVYDPTSSEDPSFRLSSFTAGANQVAHDLESLVDCIKQDVLAIIRPRRRSRSGSRNDQQEMFSCPYCGMEDLSEDMLWRHCPAFHINWPEAVPVSNTCPVCCKRVLHIPMQVHIHENHGPRSRGHKKIPMKLYNFALVVCRNPITGKFLLCQEFSDQGFWLPGGAVDGGEILSEAAVRETREETGVEIDLRGILEFEYQPCEKLAYEDDFYVRLRVVFYAEPHSDFSTGVKMPKSRPDFESAGACWCSSVDIHSDGVRLRGNEPRRWSRYLDDGGAIYPLDILKEKKRY